MYRNLGLPNLKGQPMYPYFLHCLRLWKIWKTLRCWQNLLIYLHGYPFAVWNLRLKQNFPFFLFKDPPFKIIGFTGKPWIERTWTPYCGCCISREIIRKRNKINLISFQLKINIGMNPFTSPTSLGPSDFS